MIETVPFTKEGFDRLKVELEHLKSVERPTIIREIADARSHGDLSENAEYHAAKEKQGFIEGRIADLEDKLSRGQVIESDADGQGDEDRVKFGAWVTLLDEDNGESKSFRIVGDLEADIQQGLISLSSPLARAVLGKRAGHTVEVRVPKGELEYTITEVRYR